VQAERLLIINADDLGLAPGVTRGILALARLGVVTSTSLLPNLPGSAAALAAAREMGLDVGLHLNLCAGAPLSSPGAVPSLLRRAGAFATAGEITRRRYAGRLRLDDVEREWRAQIEWCLARGILPSHLDSHCQLHGLSGLYHLTLRLARRYGIAGVRSAAAGFIVQTPYLSRLRVVTRRAPAVNSNPYRPDFFSVLSVLGQMRSARPLQALLRALPPGVTELVCHPGHVDDELRRLDPLTNRREREWLLLTRPLFRDLLRNEGIRLVSWADLAGEWWGVRSITPGHMR
jgi:hypothetical protein